MFDSEAFAKNIRLHRRKSGLSQKDLGERLFVSAQSVSKWEQGSAIPDVPKLCKLAEILGVSVADLLGSRENRRKQYMVAIDGGGTKTEFVLLDIQGTVCKQVIRGGTNPNAAGLAEACGVLRSGIAAFDVQDEQIIGIFAGISGCGIEKNQTAVTAFLQKQYPRAVIRCDTDVLNVLGCLPDAENCVLAICGTGSVVYAHENGSLHRLGGWGYLLDGDGSGFGIGKDALCAALAQEEGIGAQTIITALVEQQLGSPVWQRIEHIYSLGQKYVASFAPLVFQAFHQGDEPAKAILQHHFGRMAFLIQEALGRYACGQTVIVSGGLLKEQQVMMEMLQAHLPVSVRLVVPKYPQIFGACIQCCRLCRVDTALLEKTFAKDYTKAGAKHDA